MTLKYNLEQSTSTLIKKLNRLLISFSINDVQKMGLQMAYTYFLMHLWDQPNQTQSQLHKKIGIEQPTAVRTLDRMERDGFITRKLSKTDRRRIDICLTQKAHDIKEPLLNYAAYLNKNLLKGFNNQERQQLNSFLQRMIDNLDQLK